LSPIPLAKPALGFLHSDKDHTDSLPDAALIDISNDDLTASSNPSSASTIFSSASASPLNPSPLLSGYYQSDIEESECSSDKDASILRDFPAALIDLTLDELHTATTTSGAIPACDIFSTSSSSLLNPTLATNSGFISTSVSTGHPGPNSSSNDESHATVANTAQIDVIVISLP
jgi:hypothetical protein